MFNRNSMVSRLMRFSNASALTLALILTGCTDAPISEKSTTSSEPHAHAADGEDHSHAAGHPHASEGPHHGLLVELGGDAYHAELVHTDDGEVTVYILDGTATKAVPIEAQDITINLSHSGNAEQFQLPAAPEAGDPAGMSSRFTLSDPHRGEDLDAEGATAKLVITINGKPYSGRIAHTHDHAGLGHDH